VNGNCGAGALVSGEPRLRGPLKLCKATRISVGAAQLAPYIYMNRASGFLELPLGHLWTSERAPVGVPRLTIPDFRVAYHQVRRSTYWSLWESCSGLRFRLL